MTIVAAIASGWQEDGIAVTTNHKVTFHAIFLDQIPRATVDEFARLVERRHAPSATPSCARYIVLEVEREFVVAHAILRIVAILGDFVVVAAVSIRVPTVEIFTVNFAPSVVIAKIFGHDGANIVVGPFHTKSEIDHLANSSDLFFVFRSARRGKQRHAHKRNSA